MKQSVGGTYIYNLVIVFLLVAFGFLMASVSYSKAYRVSKGVLSIIENYSGYAGNNSATKTALERYLKTMGYNMSPIETNDCPVKKGKKAKWAPAGICIYETAKQARADDSSKTEYITYGVVSYMRIDLPLISAIKIPIDGETEKIYVFN